MREEAGLTQSALSPKLGLHPSLIHRPEAVERRIAPIEFAQWQERVALNRWTRWRSSNHSR